MYEKNINGYNYWVESMSKFGRSYYGVYTDNIELFGYDLIFVGTDYDICVDYINMICYNF